MIAAPRKPHDSHPDRRHGTRCHNLRTLFAERWQRSPQPVPLTLRAGWRSVTGNYRERNEDRCVADADRGVLLVVDGVGGQKGGREASEIVARVLSEWLSQTVKCGWRDGDVIAAAVADAVEAARKEMIERSDRRPDLQRMAATMALALVVDESLFVAHAGDCRAYLLHEGRLQRLTKDETFVQAAIDAGFLTEATAGEHPWSHVVTNAVSVKALERPMEVDEFHLSPGDRVLLCTDGLTGVVSDVRLRQMLMNFRDVNDAAAALVEAALESDSKDNVTCVVADVRSAETSDEACLGDRSLLTA